MNTTKIIETHEIRTLKEWWVELKNLVWGKVEICDIDIIWYHIFLYMREIFPCGVIRCIHFVSRAAGIVSLSLADVIYWRRSLCWLHKAVNSIVIDAVRALFDFLLQGAHQGGVLDPDFPWQNRPYPEIPLKFFDFPDPEFSSSSSRQVFLFSTESLI